MNENTLYQHLENYPIISAVKDDVGLEKCIESESRIVFVLYGSINNISDIVSRLKKADKTVFVHADLIDGLANREASIEFLNSAVKPDGIISTKLSLIKRAKSLGMLTVMRFFVIDSRAMENIRHCDLKQYADFIEILPGLMPKIINKVSQLTKKPVIAGGMIDEKDDVVTALSSGAVAISTTNTKVWFL
ncbi:MAG: glycerol-3-phosphate responsive antiterminator [Clostridiales bacterium]|nr:glycerol-3-phosphate responsive antiterminator [Clostridiales bacterium]